MVLSVLSKNVSSELALPEVTGCHDDQIYILSVRAAVDPLHSDAEGTGLKEIMVGEAFDELSDADNGQP